MVDLPHSTETRRLELRFGLVAVAERVQWADSMVLERDEWCDDLAEDTPFMYGIDGVFDLAEEDIYGNREEEGTPLLGDVASLDKTASKTIR